MVVLVVLARVCVGPLLAGLGVGAQRLQLGERGAEEEADSRGDVFAVVGRSVFLSFHVFHSFHVLGGLASVFVLRPAHALVLRTHCILYRLRIVSLIPRRYLICTSHPRTRCSYFYFLLFNTICLSPFCVRNCERWKVTVESRANETMAAVVAVDGMMAALDGRLNTRQSLFEFFPNVVFRKFRSYYFPQTLSTAPFLQRIFSTLPMELSSVEVNQVSESTEILRRRPSESHIGPGFLSSRQPA